MQQIDKHLIETFNEYFVNHRQRKRYEQTFNEGKWGYHAKRLSITPYSLEQHLLGKITLGSCNLDDDDNTRFMGIDSDDDSGKLKIFNDCLINYGWQTIREGSRSGRDGHLWLLLTKPIPGEIAHDYIRLLIRRAGLSEDDFDKIFPMQRIAPNFGSCVKLPLAHHKKPSANGAIGWFEGVDHNLQTQLLWLTQQKRNDADKVIQLALSERKPVNPIKRIKQRGSNQGRFDFIQYAKDNNFSRRGDWFIGLCPACKQTNHDADSNHLGVNASTGGVSCWRGCDFLAILAAIKRAAYMVA